MVDLLLKRRRRLKGRSGRHSTSSLGLGLLDGEVPFVPQRLGPGTGTRRTGL
jgi:hypothetical protein